ncbi:MAG: tyrosine--tRNA ligase [Minisyncoccia bacterium]
MFWSNKLSSVIVDSVKIQELLVRGVEEVIDKKSLDNKLFSGKELVIKLGIDPTSPNIHIGRSIPLLKLRDFQELGHKIVFIIGDFTGVIGDTSDKESERPMLTKEEVERNMDNYISQASKIIDIKKSEVRYNSEWLSKISYEELGRQADVFSLSDFISRENIKKRLDAGKRVSLRELLYPLMQGYDSVAIKADVEIGGTDQRFNLLSGRELQRLYKQSPQDILTNPLIEGLDGRKMSSSWGNTINLLDNNHDMFGKIMSLSDNLIIKYFTLTTRVSLIKIAEYEKALSSGENPKKIKVLLAKEIVKIYHGEKRADEAEKNFENTFSKGGVPEEVLEVSVARNTRLWDLLISEKIISSKTEWRRLVLEKAVTKMEDDKRIENTEEVVQDGVYKIGKKRFIKIKTI